MIFKEKLLNFMVYNYGDLDEVNCYKGYFIIN